VEVGADEPELVADALPDFELAAEEAAEAARGDLLALPDAADDVAEEAAEAADEEAAEADAVWEAAGDDVESTVLEDSTTNWGV